jgi:tRNA U34 2-thiouridine synthase MnmA/TrmU
LVGFSSPRRPLILFLREIKFGALARRVLRDSGAQWLATGVSCVFHLICRRHPYRRFSTGHYAQISWSDATDPSGSRPRLFRASDLNKDQTYYLASITEDNLRHVCLAAGAYMFRTHRRLDAIIIGSISNRSSYQTPGSGNRQTEGIA